MIDWRVVTTYSDEWGERYEDTRADNLRSDMERYAPAPEAAQYYETLTAPCATCGGTDSAVNGYGVRWCRQCLTIIKGD